MKNPNDDPPREVVLPDRSGWITGPSAGTGPVTADDSALDRLRADWPRWQVWVVPGTEGGPPTWCARRHEDRDAVPARVLNAGSAEHLAEYLEEASSR